MKQIRMTVIGLTAAALLAGASPVAGAAEGAAPVSVPAAADSSGTALAARGEMKVLKWMSYSRSKKHPMPLRLGTYKRNSRGKMVGHGWTKIKKRHNIQKYGIVAWLAKSPRVKHVRGKRYNLTGWAHRISCKSGGCKVVSRIPMLLATDETWINTGGHPSRDSYYGAVTAYCNYGNKNKLKCPTWVNTKFKPKASLQTLNARGGGERYAFTYKPLKSVKGTLVTAS
ncbi:hypothetical protein ACIBKX_11245 [Streptomyces sp. NPDC050658]|uniref:hypothetical protein n=1 Tax=unclassified Streptomyces TaxID=2593676 RepID=UPI00341D44D6